jgi:hypothetical protein
MHLRRAVGSSLLISCYVGAFAAAQVAPAKPEESAAVKEAREQALLHVRGLAGKIENLSGENARYTGLGRLAELTCKEFPEFARGLFLKAHEIARGIKAAATPGGAPAAEGPALSAADGVVAQIARCDPDLAFRIHEEIKKEEERAPANPLNDVRVAFSLAREQPEKAADFAARAAGASLDLQTLQALASVMRMLAPTQQERSNAIFVQVMNALAAEPRADSMRLLEIGSYLFGLPDASGVAQPSTQGYQAIAGVGVTNIMGVRPWTRPPQARLYLEMSLNILSRPVTDSRMNRQDYAAAYQMRHLAQKFAPELVALYSALMEKLLGQGQVPPAIAQAATNLDRFTARDPADISKEGADSPDPAVRERRLVNLLPALLRRGEFDSARKACEDLRDLKSREAAMEVIDYSEAARALQGGNIEPARRTSEKVKDRVLRSLLRAAAGAELVRQGSRDAAVQEHFSAQREASQAEPRIRAYLMAVIASGIADVEAALAIEPLQAAVVAFNELDRAGAETVRLASGPFIPGSSRTPTNPYTWASSYGFQQVIHIGTGQQGFSLSVRGIADYDITPSLLKKFHAEAERVEAAFNEFATDTRKATALATVAVAYLEQIAQAKKKKEPAERQQ